MQPSEITPKHVGKNLTDVREEFGISRKELAERSGYGRSTIDQIELGYCYPSVTTLIDICAVLGVTPNDILIGKGHESKGGIGGRPCRAQPHRRASGRA